MEKIKFLDESGAFSIKSPENYSALYFPIASEKGLKSAVTPNLGGDSKLDQETFLLEPVSVENLHNNRSTRNFWCNVENVGCWSVTGASAEEENKKFTDEQDSSELTAGLMWHTVRRTSRKYKLESEATLFVPAEENVEIMYVKIRNTAGVSQKVTPIAAVPIYGRSADNIRDHRNVTSMLHRIRTEKYGVLVKPTMSFDEKGHRRNHQIYFVEGITGNGKAPVSFYPTAESFIGEGGTFTHPRAVYMDMPGVPAKTEAAGKEAMGGIRFETIVLDPEETAEYLIFAGTAEEEEQVERVISLYGSHGKAVQALEAVKKYWQEKVNVSYHTGDSRFDLFMRWVSFQPLLRRLYGCSFLPHHDYGRGGRGWRDLWQDCLSLLLMDPGDVRKMILDNYGGVRIDGTNATIIGSRQGTFLADRNGISRVWMDHAVWPLMTTKLYIDQTGDIGILTERVAYFKDPQSMRGTDTDNEWNEEYGMQQKTADGSIYCGSVLEHLLIEHLSAFYEVGDHNIMRLRGADWNDALDMAPHHGESVAFTCAYAGNFKELAHCLALLRDNMACTEIALMEEIAVLLKDEPEMYEDIQTKHETLREYLKACRHHISGKTILVPVDKVIENLNHKADWMMEHIRKQEWINGEDGEGWFNSYYDDHKNAVEGFFENGVRMMLTGQVFAVMSGTATEEQTAEICKSADHYLYDPEVGGYRLNTDFHELKFDMGRMFGFAYGEKENGAVFSHMAIMYANALYKRGFVKEGYQALRTLADTALDFETSRIYPGIPEYFNREGRGMYHYLTGAASWYMMTMITEVFGVHGKAGSLAVRPRLMKSQFDAVGKAGIRLTFAGKKFEILYHNEGALEYGEYRIGSAKCDGVPMQNTDRGAVMDRAAVEALGDGEHQIQVALVPRDMAAE
ncbi:GH36-type glycosyl hydrolase domain-containing protein [Ruminococcus sp. 5_1_39BFAA]|uniref:GH36-type glycosyl hydrolase domain-containing protein n=1 Tax=Ruminococcus sp. 5_1_39BFAA TaxID=457412 RepID=UPI00356394EF